MDETVAAKEGPSVLRIGSPAGASGSGAAGVGVGVAAGVGVGVAAGVGLGIGAEVVGMGAVSVPTGLGVIDGSSSSVGPQPENPAAAMRALKGSVKVRGSLGMGVVEVLSWICPEKRAHCEAG